MEADNRNVPLSQKVLDDKPAGASDECFIGPSLTETTDPAACAAAFPHYGDARLGAGESMTDNAMQCQLKPLDRADYPVTFTDDSGRASNRHSRTASATGASSRSASNRPSPGSPSRAAPAANPSRPHRSLIQAHKSPSNERGRAARRRAAPGTSDGSGPRAAESGLRLGISGTSFVVRAVT